MVNFKQKFLTAAMIFGVSLSLFAQKGNDNSNRRPPKEPPQVVVREKDRPAPSRPNDKKDDKKGKP